jgi:predicted  nucleic acid-binding Zn-ribbon protein
MEKDVREIIGVSEQEEVPVILDLESIRVIKPGKFEIDIVNLFNKKRPLIYKLEEGKYIIDLASTLKLNAEQLNEKIKYPEKLGR